MHNLSHVKTERTNMSAQLQTLVKNCHSCHHRSFPFVPPSAISSKRNPNFFASARVRNPSRCFVKKIGCVVLRIHSTHGYAEGLHRLLYCSPLRLSPCSAQWFVSSTLSTRFPATGIDESAGEDHPYTSPTGKLSVSKSSLCRRHSIEVCPLGKPPVANSHHHVSRH